MKKLIAITFISLFIASAYGADELAAPLPTHQLPLAKNGGTVIGNCDGKSSVEVPNMHGKPLAHDQAQAVADELMAQWKKQHPGQDWIAHAEAAEQETSSQPQMSSNQQTGTYSNFTDTDRKLWLDETAKFIARGKDLFHSDKAIGGTTGIACAMCHPSGSNTHPETYPKYQVQLGRVALLRDMINWCIENPVKGKAFKDDDVRLRALEAYILSTRKGTPLEYGKH
jgi:thiosulfate dehydrogenase